LYLALGFGDGFAGAKSCFSAGAFFFASPSRFIEPVLVLYPSKGSALTTLFLLLVVGTKVHSLASLSA